MISWRATVSDSGQDSNVKAVSFETEGLMSAEHLADQAKRAAARAGLNSQYVWRIEKVGENQDKLAQPQLVLPSVSMPASTIATIVTKSKEENHLDSIDERLSTIYQVCQNIRAKLDDMQKQLAELQAR